MAKGQVLGSAGDGANVVETTQDLSEARVDLGIWTNQRSL